MIKCVKDFWVDKHSSCYYISVRAKDKCHNIFHPCTLDSGEWSLPFSLLILYYSGDHYIHLYWSQVPLEKSPIIAYCPGPLLPIDHRQVIIRGTGHEFARATVPAEFMIDGKLAGPGKWHCLVMMLNIIIDDNRWASLISRLPGKAPRTLVESQGLPSNSTCFSKPSLVNLMTKDAHPIDFRVD